MATPTQRTTARGFTFVEVIVAIAVLTFLAFTPLTIIADYVVHNEVSREQAQAQAIAQNAIDFVRNSRDANVLDRAAAADWFTSLQFDGNPLKSCTIGYDRWADTLGGDLLSSPYCRLSCVAAGVDRDEASNIVTCGAASPADPLTYPSIVVNVASANPVFRSSENGNTCSGQDPNSSGSGFFDVTLNLVLPEPESPLHGDHAIVSACVSWKSANRAVQKVHLNEGLFGWVAR